MVSLPAVSSTNILKSMVRQEICAEMKRLAGRRWISEDDIEAQLQLNIHPFNPTKLTRRYLHRQQRWESSPKSGTSPVVDSHPSHSQSSPSPAWRTSSRNTSTTGPPSPAHPCTRPSPPTASPDSPTGVIALEGTAKSATSLNSATPLNLVRTPRREYSACRGIMWCWMRM